MARSTGSARARLLGPALRRLYEEHKITLRELETRTGIPNSTLSRMFSGARPISLDQTTKILDALDVVGTARTEILHRAAGEDSGGGWWPIGVPNPAMHLAAMLEFDRAVSHFVEVSSLLFPSITQTGGYARAIIGGAAPRHEVEHRVAVRLGRREMLTRRTNPVHATVVIGQAALENEIGGPEVMIEQFSHMLDLAKVMDFRILPINVGYHDCLPNPAFSFLRFPDDSPLVHIEIGDSGMYIDDERFVDWYDKAVREVLTLALSPEMSVKKVTEMLTGRMGTR